MDYKTLIFLLCLVLISACTKKDPIQYELTTSVLPVEGGTISPASGLYKEGESVILTATPASEYFFTGWLDGVNGTSNPVNVVMNSKKTITAIFEKIPVKIDFATKYSPYQNISYSKPTIIPNLHVESIKAIDVNGKKYLITSNADLFGTSYDFFRSFLVDTITGLITENTNTFLGGYYESGFPKSPFWYEDLNGDNLKDLFISDHGKETPSLMENGKFPGFVCHLFLANQNGTFSAGSVDDITSIKRFYHSSGVGDVDGDGKKDLVVQAFSKEEIMLFLNSEGTLLKKINITPNNQTGSVWIGDVDGDNQSEILSAPYIDRGTTPSTYIKSIKLHGSTFSTSNISQLRPFGDGFGCYKIIALKNPKNQSLTNIFYFVEAGIGASKIFRSKDGDITQLDEISLVQSTPHSNGARDFQILDINFDGLDDIFFYVNPGLNLNSRVWLNKGDNTFEYPSWEIDASLTETFIPLSTEPKSGRTKFLYYGWNGSVPATKLIDVYTNKR